MISYVARRTLAAAPLVVGVLTLVFLLVQLVPGRALTLEPGTGVDPHASDQLRRIFGTDRPLPERYLAWLAGFLTGDLGLSISFRRPVMDLVAEAVGNTFLLAGLAILLQFLLGIGAGLLAVSSRSSAVDRSITAAAGIVYSIPSYWLGLVLVGLLSVRLGWLPVSAMHAIDAPTLGRWERLLDSARHLVLPCLSLTLPAAAGISLYVRDEMVAILGRPFVKAASARGVSRAEVIARHGLRGALLPLVNLFGLALPGLVGGSVVIEVLFAWPGMGRLAYQAVLSRDEPLILGCAWIATVLVIFGSLVADLLSAAIDPRVRETIP